MTAAFQYTTSVTPQLSGALAEKRSSYRSKKSNADLSNVQEPIASATPEVREIIERVLQAEKDKLYMRPPRNINDDVLKIIKDVIQ